LRRAIDADPQDADRAALLHLAVAASSARAITEALAPAVDAQPYGCKATVLRRWARVASINTYSFVL
jgi:hypothetical protein